MSIKKTIKYLSIGAIIFTSTLSFANEEYNLSLFNQVADKVTSLYLKEAIVGLDIIDNVYSDKKLLENIEVRLNEDTETKEYLDSRGFDLEKIADTTLFINNMFPTAEEILTPDEGSNNIIVRLIKSILIEENNTLNFSKYEKDFDKLGKELYAIMPSEVKDVLALHFDSQQKREQALIKIMTEYIYSGHGCGKYEGKEQRYTDLKLEIDDDFIKNVNIELGVPLLNKNVLKSINIFLGGVEDTLKEKKLDKIYSDITSVLNLIDTNCDNNLREENIANSLKDNESKDEIDVMEEKKINRAELLKLLFNNIEADPIEYSGEFVDISKDDFYADYIAAAKSIGLISGYKDSTFRPQSKVTRSEMLSMISNTMNFMGSKIEVDQQNIDTLLKEFKYKDDIDAWVKTDIAKLVKAKVLDKTYDKAFGVNEFITRDEAISIIDKINID